MKSTIITCLRTMLAPIVRFSLKHSCTFPEFVEAARIVFVQVGADQMSKSGRKVNISRLSLMTGIQRKAVTEIFESDVQPEKVSKIAKVIGKWSFDKRYSTPKGPRRLSFGDDSSEFSKLVRAVNKEYHPSLVLFELERLGVVKRTEQGLELVSGVYEPHGDQVKILGLLAADVDDLISAVQQNIDSSPDSMPNFHAKSTFDNIAEEDLPKIREWFMKHLSIFHSKVERYLSKKDLDLEGTRTEGTSGKRIVYGSFSRTL